MDILVTKQQAFLQSCGFFVAAGTLGAVVTVSDFTILNIAVIVLAGIALVHAANSASNLMPPMIGKIVRWVYAQINETIALIWLGVLRIFSLFRKNSVTAPFLNQRPILLVHGYLHSGFVWDFHKAKLAKKGYGPIYTIDLGGPFNSIANYANKVEKMAQQISKETGRSDLTLIGHSMGGIVSSYYAVSIAPPNTVAQIITIASPLQGTHLAKFAIGDCGREMEIDSQFLKNLKQKLLDIKDLNIYHIATETDQIVIPYTSSLLISDPQRHYIIDDVGHAALLLSRRVTHKLAEWLEEAPV